MGFLELYNQRRKYDGGSLSDEMIQESPDHTFCAFASPFCAFTLVVKFRGGRMYPYQQQQQQQQPAQQFPSAAVSDVQPREGYSFGATNGTGENGASVGDRKRPYEGEGTGGREFKRQQQPQDRDTVFRLLVPATRVGAVIGKAGAIVREIRNATKARIRVCEGVPNCDERVIVISARDATPDDTNQAQRALAEVHRRVVDAEVESREQSGKTFNMLTRLLVNHTQAGSIIGKGGCITKDIRESTGAFCKILPQEDIPVCALHNDRVVLISGQAEQLKAALVIVCRQIRDNPPREVPGGPPPSLSILHGYTLYNAHGAPPPPPPMQYPFSMPGVQTFPPPPPAFIPQAPMPYPGAPPPGYY